MNLQFLSQCERHQGLNPETGRCYDVCKPGEVYKAQEGCEPDSFVKQYGVLMGTAILFGTIFWLSTRRSR